MQSFLGQLGGQSFYLQFTGWQCKSGDFLGQNCQMLSKQFVVNSQLRLDSKAPSPACALTSTENKMEVQAGIFLLFN